MRGHYSTVEFSSLWNLAFSPMNSTPFHLTVSVWKNPVEESRSPRSPPSPIHLDFLDDKGRWLLASNPLTDAAAQHTSTNCVHLQQELLLSDGVQSLWARSAVFYLPNSSLSVCLCVRESQRSLLGVSLSLSPVWFLKHAPMLTEPGVCSLATLLD